MTETHTDFLQYAGSTWEFDAALHDADKNPLDLTGAAIAWRLYDASRNAKLDLALGTGIALVNATGGLCKITVTSAQSAALAPGSYRDEIVVTMPGGFVSTQAVGTIVVQLPGSIPAPPGAALDPCATLAQLRNARVTLLAGGQPSRVRIEGFEVQYGAVNLDALNRAITEYDSLCRKQSGDTKPRRFAIGSGARSRTG